MAYESIGHVSHRCHLIFLVADGFLTHVHAKVYGTPTFIKMVSRFPFFTRARGAPVDDIAKSYSNILALEEGRGSTKGTCYCYCRENRCPSKDLTVVLVIDYKTEVEASVGIFGRLNNHGRSH